MAAALFFALCELLARGFFFPSFLGVPRVGHGVWGRARAAEVGARWARLGKAGGPCKIRSDKGNSNPERSLVTGALRGGNNNFAHLSIARIRR